MYTLTEKARFVLHFCDTLFQLKSSQDFTNFNYNGFQKGARKNTFLAPFLSLTQLEYGWLCRKPSPFWISKHTLLTYFSSEKDTLLQNFSILEKQNNSETHHVQFTQDCRTHFTRFIQTPTLTTYAPLYASFVSFLSALIAAEKTVPHPTWKTGLTATFQILDTLLQLAIRLELDFKTTSEALTQLTKLVPKTLTLPQIVHQDHIHYLLGTYAFRAWVTYPTMGNSTQLYWAGWSFAQQLIAFSDGFYNRNSVEKEFKKKLNQFLKYKQKLSLLITQDPYLLHAFSEGFFTYLETQPNTNPVIGASFIHHLTNNADTKTMCDLFIVLGSRTYFHDCLLLTVSSQEDVSNTTPASVVQKWLNLTDFPFQAITHALPQNQQHASAAFPLLRYADIESTESLLQHLTSIAPPEFTELRLFLTYYFNLSNQSLPFSFDCITQKIIEDEISIINCIYPKFDNKIHPLLEKLLLICPAYILTEYFNQNSLSDNQQFIERITEIDLNLTQQNRIFFAHITPEQLNTLIQPNDALSQVYLALFIDCIKQTIPKKASDDI